MAASKELMERIGRMLFPVLWDDKAMLPTTTPGWTLQKGQTSANAEMVSLNHNAFGVFRLMAQNPDKVGRDGQPTAGVQLSKAGYRVAWLVHGSGESAIWSALIQRASVQSQRCGLLGSLRWQR